jgi:hypothetical protein
MAQKLDDASDVISLTRALKLDPRKGSVQEILRFCNERIAKWVNTAGGVSTIGELEKLVCRRLHLVMEEVWSDEDLTGIIRKYVGMGEAAFASLGFQLNEDTFATLMERHQVRAGAPDRYVAVIDCRGVKAARRFFTRWHEIAHLLTLVDQLELPFHRSTTEQNPTERLMDVIAGEVGFYNPIFEPVLMAELAGTGHLTFVCVERVRAAACPDASYAASLIACVKRVPHPVVHLEVGAGLKKEEAARLRSGQLDIFPTPNPVAKLRALKSSSNPTARKFGFVIHQNMQIPSASTIARHFAESDGVEMTGGVVGQEDLAIWTHSNGVPIGEGQVRVQARRIAGVLNALVQPLDRNA